MSCPISLADCNLKLTAKSYFVFDSVLPKKTNRSRLSTIMPWFNLTLFNNEHGLHYYLADTADKKTQLNQ